MNSAIDQRYVIVNADDLGLSQGINEGIIEAYENGIVTSASLIVRSPRAIEACAYGRDHPQLSVGLHIDLGEWVFRAGSWEQTYSYVSVDNAGAVQKEIHHQFDLCCDLLGALPSHLDSHQHVHVGGAARLVTAELAHEYHLPVRHITSEIRYVGDFYGQSKRGDSFPEGVTVDALIRLVTQVQPGITEIGCHPGRGVDFNSIYASERENEVLALCDPAVRAAVEREAVVLCSFSSQPVRERCSL